MLCHNILQRRLEFRILGLKFQVFSFSEKEHLHVNVNFTQSCKECECNKSDHLCHLLSSEWILLMICWPMVSSFAQIMFSHMERVDARLYVNSTGLAKRFAAGFQMPSLGSVSQQCDPLIWTGALLLLSTGHSVMYLC
jgi:hypothetical protein